MVYGWQLQDCSWRKRDLTHQTLSSLYSLLEEKIVPLYYARDRVGVPHGWLSLVKEAIRSIVPVFCARRMLKEYTERMYKAAAQSTQTV